MSFKEFLEQKIQNQKKRAHSEDYSLDFANDALDDADFPTDVSSIKRVLSYVSSKGACENCLDGALQALNEYFKKQNNSLQ